MTRVGAAAVLTCAAWLGGCAMQVPFELVVTLAVQGPPGEAQEELTADLSQEAALWANRDAVEDVRLEALEVRVVALGPANRAAEVALAVGLRPEGAAPSGEEDLVVLPETALELGPGTGLYADVAPGPGNAVVLAALAGSGKLRVMANVRAPLPVDVTLEVRVRGTATVAP